MADSFSCSPQSSFLQLSRCVLSLQGGLFKFEAVRKIRCEHSLGEASTGIIALLAVVESGSSQILQKSPRQRRTLS